MTTRRFFQLSLALPLIFGLVGLAVPAAKVLGTTLVFGCIPYLPLAALLYVLLRRSKTKQALILLSAVAPLAFAPLVLGLVAALGLLDPGMRAAPISDIVQGLIPFPVYAACYGYFYVLLAWGMWALCRRLRLVIDEFES